MIILGHACRPVRNVQDQSWFCYVDAVQIHAYQSGQRWFVRVELSGDADVTVAGNAITLSAAEDKVRVALMRYVPTSRAESGCLRTTRTQRRDRLGGGGRQ